MITIDEQITWVERQIEFESDELYGNQYDVPILKAILESLEDYEAFKNYEQPTQ